MFALGVGGLACAAISAGCVTAVEGALGISPIWLKAFSHGREEWHLGLETVENMNIIHIGNSLKYGVHIAFGAVEPYVADLHIYLQEAFPFFRIFRP